MPRPRACLFDLDGLLLDTEPLHARAWSQAAAAFGVMLSDVQLQGLRGRRRLDCADQVRRWIEADGGPPLSSDDLLAVRQPLADQLLAQAPAMPGADALVRRCEGLAIPMALATSSSRQAVALKSRPHPWLALIRTRVHGEDPELVARKPAPDVFLLAARRLGVPASDCWALEDSVAGAVAAATAGCRVYVLAPPGQVQAPYPDGVTWLTGLDQLPLD